MKRWFWKGRKKWIHNRQPDHNLLLLNGHFRNLECLLLKIRICNFAKSLNYRLQKF